MPYLRKITHTDKTSGKTTTRWQATVRLSNGKRRSLTFDLKGEARQWGIDEESRIRRGEWADPRLTRITAGEWHERWKAARVVSPETARGDVSSHKRITAQWGNDPLPSIGRLEIQAWITRMEAAGVGYGAVRHAYNLFRKMMADAVTEGVLRADPCRNIRLPKGPPGKPRFFTHDQAGVLLDHLTEPHRTMTLVMLWCGLRWGEAAGLRACDVIWLRRRISIEGKMSQDGKWQPYAKTSTSHGEVPVPDHVLQALSARAGGMAGEELLFRTKRGDRPLIGGNWRRNIWYPAIEAAGVPAYSPHTCRHTAASWLVQAGAPIYDVQRILRHGSVQTTQIYAHLAPDSYDAIESAWGRMTLQRRSAGE